MSMRPSPSPGTRMPPALHTRNFSRRSSISTVRSFFMAQNPGVSRKWPYAAGLAIGLLAGLVLVIFLRARNIDDRTREWVVGELRQRFNSEVELDGLHVEVFPRMGV